MEFSETAMKRAEFLTERILAPTIPPGMKRLANVHEPTDQPDPSFVRHQSELLFGVAG